MKVTILGARGSMPVEGPEYTEFGGGTTCVLVETESQAIFIDAGTGIIKAPAIANKDISILLTHPHLDHLLGLPFFEVLRSKGKQINFYACVRDGKTAKEQIDGLFDVPYWPCKIENYPAEVIYHDLKLPTMIGDVKVEGIEAIHPGGSIVYKLIHEGKSVVISTDYEFDEEMSGDLVDFAKDTDLLLMDAQYTEEEYKERMGFGHSTLKQAMKVFKECNGKNVRFVHHDPFHNDEFLRNLEQPIKSTQIMFAREGEEIVL